MFVRINGHLFVNYFMGKAHKNCTIQVCNCEKMKFIIRNYTIRICLVRHII